MDNLDNYVIESFKDLEINISETEDNKKNICLKNVIVRSIDKNKFGEMDIYINNIDKEDFYFLIR